MKSENTKKSTIATTKKPTLKNRAKENTEIMKNQKPEVRIKNMKEVALGFSQSQAVKEAERCLNCVTHPCMNGCPVGINIPKFLGEVAKKEFEKADCTIKESSLFPSICGRVCPQEKQCQKECTVGKMHKNVDEAVAIGRVERFVADWVRENGKEARAKKAKSNGKKVAIVGSGPSGAACAADLAKKGYEVHIFEAFHKAGGVLTYGIPEFRLPKEIVKKEFENLEKLGVKIHLDTLIGRTRTIKQLMSEDGFNAVFVGSGAGLPNFLHIPGENAVGVVSANEYLSRINLMKAYDKKVARTPYPSAKRVAVFGAGNVAMDASRTARRMGAESVAIIYRRGEEEVPARKEEVQHAKEEGIKFMLLHAPKEILTDEKGKVKGVVLLECKLGEPDASGRRRPEIMPGSEKTYNCDLVIVAIGNASNPLIKMTTPEIETNARGNFVVNPDTLETSMKGVFAGGDIVLGAATVILAMGQGRKAAKGIDSYLSC